MGQQQPGMLSSLFGQGQVQMPPQRTCGTNIDGSTNGLPNEQPSCVKPGVFGGYFGFGGKRRRRQRGGFDPYDPAAQNQALVGGRRQRGGFDPYDPAFQNQALVGGRRRKSTKRKGTKRRRNKKSRRTYKRR
jgi:hypothetical protein